MVSEPNYGPELEVTSGDNAWPCVIIMLIFCLMILGMCFAGVYFLINVPQ